MKRFLAGALAVCLCFSNITVGYAGTKDNNSQTYEVSLQSQTEYADAQKEAGEQTEYADAGRAETVTEISGEQTGENVTEKSAADETKAAYDENSTEVSGEAAEAADDAANKATDEAENVTENITEDSTKDAIESTSGIASEVTTEYASEPVTEAGTEAITEAVTEAVVPLPLLTAVYEGAINSELISFSLGKTDSGAYYLSGEIVVVEWINGVSTVPKDTPVMKFKTADGTESIDVFVTPTGTNTYYFDRFIENLPEGKDFLFEISSGTAANVSTSRKMNVLLSTSPKVAKSALLGITANQRIIYKMNDIGELAIYATGLSYTGNINSELIKTEYVKGANGNFVSGQIVVVEWIENDTVSTVPAYKPSMSFCSVDGTEQLDVFVTAVGTNTYYFDRLLGDMEIGKEYVFKIESGDPNNISDRRSMKVTTTALSKKEGVLWRTSTQNVCYRTDENSGEMRIYAVESEGVESKKGIQGFEYREDTDWQSLGVKHVLLNMDLTQCINAHPTASSYPVYYNGKPHYYTDYVNRQRSMVEQLTSEGVEVTMVLLLSWEDDLSYLTYAGWKSTAPQYSPYYAWSVYNETAREELEALLHFIMADAYKGVSHWIVGNEVNMPLHYNYTGIDNSNVSAQADIYAEEFLMVYNMAESCGQGDKVYISLDHSWTHNDEGRGIAGKTFLTEFASKIQSKQPGAVWNVAYHAYAAIMTTSDIWNSSYTTMSENTPFISGYNINVLTDFIRNNYGENHRVSLSEQGFTARNNSNDSQQAAALAYTYYAAQFNDMIDSVIFRSFYDDANDGIFRFGLINAFSKDANRTNTSLRRPAYDVFKYMDTSYSEMYTNPYLSTVGARSWADIIPGYDATIFENIH